MTYCANCGLAIEKTDEGWIHYDGLWACPEGFGDGNVAKPGNLS